MRWLAIGVMAVLLGCAVWLWGFDGAREVSRWAADGQLQVQRAMAGYLRALKQGEPRAFASLMGLSFAYGFFHAAGPGHGKIVIGGYGMAAKITALKLSMLAVMASLAQAISAIILVGAGVLLFGLGRTQMTDIANKWMAPISATAIALVGLWLAWRGLRVLRTARRAPVHDHPHSGHHHDLCETCGHSHGPSVEQAAQTHSVRDALALIGAVALRPCTGALFLLIITWSMGIFWAGIAGALFMGLGTAGVTVAVAISAVFMRSQALSGLQDSSVLVHANGILQLGAGLLIAALASQIALAAL